MSYMIETQDLTKEYGDLVAVKQLLLSVAPGEIFGLIGPNGAGKTTTVRMLTTLLTPTQGTACINGYDIRTQARQVRASIGYVPEQVGVDEIMTGREHLVLQGRLHKMDAKIMSQRIDAVLDLVGLSQDADRRTLQYSGGMRKLLDIAAGLLHQPKVLFMDEPTSGVDVERRLHLWDYIRRLPEESSTTVFLTTHFLDEADQICDRVAILDQGKIIVQGTPTDLKASLGAEVLTVVFNRGDQAQVQSAADEIRASTSVTRVMHSGTHLKAFVTGGEKVIIEVTACLGKLALEPQVLSIAQPTLDDVFLMHVGREVN